jgi:hypothetical protein
MEAARVESLGVRERLAITPFWVLLGAHLIWLGVHSPSKKPFKPGLMASMVLTWVAIVGVFVEIPIVSDYAFWVLAAAYFLIVSVTGHQKKWSEGRFWAGHQSRFRLITREDIPSSERSIRILVMSKPGDGDKMVAWEYGAFKSEPGADYAVDDTLTPPREYIRIHCAWNSYLAALEDE